ncbi:MAG: hypothetical protein ACKO3B_07880 [Bacteroidota bacterium]
MNKIASKTTFLALFTITLLLTGCSMLPGKKVREPFRGSAYESNNRFLRATGKGESIQDNIARSKADLDAKTILAGQVNTTMQQVADQYLGETSKGTASDVADKFQSLAREVMNTNLADIRKVGEEKYYNKKENRYTVYVAYELKKSAMFSFMKKQAKIEGKLTDAQRATIDKILDEELKKTEEQK